MKNVLEAGRYTTIIWVGIGIAEESWGTILLSIVLFGLLCVCEEIWLEFKKPS